MDDHDTKAAGEANVFVRLIKKLSGQKTVVPESEQRVVRRNPESQSGVGVTNESLRQTK